MLLLSSVLSVNYIVYLQYLLKQHYHNTIIPGTDWKPEFQLEANITFLFFLTKSRPTG